MDADHPSNGVLFPRRNTSCSLSREIRLGDGLQLAVQQPSLAICLETNTPATERPLGDAKQLSGFDLVEFSQFIAAQKLRNLITRTP